MEKTAIEYYNHIKGDQEHDIRLYDKYQVIRLMERYLQSELKNIGVIGDVMSSACDEYREGINMHCAECGESKHLHRH